MIIDAAGLRKGVVAAEATSCLASQTAGRKSSHRWDAETARRPVSRAGRAVCPVSLLFAG